MKVKCISNDDGYYNALTIGEIYEVEDEDSEDYVIIDDIGDEWSYKKSLFEIVEGEKVNEETNKENKTYSTLEMAKILIDNPTYKAEYCIEPNCSEIIVVSHLGILVNENTRRPLVIVTNDNRQWKIIKPIIKVKFAEAYKYFKNYKNVEIESFQSGNVYNYNSKLFENVTDDEVDGDWIVRFKD